jgi:alcohol dehydrogenase class IV
MAGLAFDNAGLGLCHAVMHALGGAFHVPHGRLGGVMLPHVMERNKAACISHYAELAHVCGVGAATELIAYRNLKTGLIKLRRQLRLPASLQEAGIDPAQLEAQCSTLVQATLDDPCMATNPCPITAAEVETLLREAAI